MREVFRWAGAAMGTLMLTAPVVCAQLSDLPRRAGSTAEFYRGVAVLYDSIRDPAGHRLRLIVTHPQDANTRRRRRLGRGLRRNGLHCGARRVSAGVSQAQELPVRGF